MSGHLIFPGGVNSSHLLSATNQAGGAIGPVITGDGNAGQLSLSVSGSPSADVDLLATIDTPGNIKTATYKVSTDGGTNTLGRNADTETWDGNGAAQRTILADATSTPLGSNPIEIDTDGDGIPDRVLVAVMRTSTTPDQIDIMYTDDFSGAGSWAVLATDIVSEEPHSKPTLVVRGDDVFMIMCVVTSYDLVIYKSVDFGLTWGAPTTITSATEHTGESAIALQSGKLLVAYVDDDGAYNHIFCKSSSDGITWGTARKITAAGSVGYSYPVLIQEASGKTICFMYRVTATAGLKARQSTKADPGSAAWSADYSELAKLPADAYTPSGVSIAPDGSIYLLAVDGTTIYYSKFKDGDANYSAYSEPITLANNISSAKCAFIGGALWVVANDSSAYDVVLVIAKYWKAYNASTAPASWTGTSPQFIASGVWATWGGANGGSGDTFAADTEYDYGADRMVVLRPSHPSRSTADEAEWSVVFDLGANVLVPVDTICLYANVESLHFQMDADNTFGTHASPTASVNTSVSFVRESIADASHTVAAGKLTRSSGTWQPHELAGLHGKFATSGNVYLIRDNDSTVCYIDADISSEAGTFSILSPRAWITQTAASYRYIRILIESQKTVAGYYQVGALVAGVRHALAAYHSSRTDWSIPVDDIKLNSGGIIRTSYGNPRRKWTLTFNKPTANEYSAITSGIIQRGSQPFAYVPDTTKSYDWALVHADSVLSWESTRTTVNIEEVV